ncbi:hypothetical protein [Nocardia sp. CC201C]|uniref:TPR repeat region-containing protein n=1 Tax=Nocardia sp. CC201C TaxID=3044575 RepID=UPI0024A9C3AB|nr:hypothetical protein [Nocardia sp. CC201C]
MAPTDQPVTISHVRASAPSTMVALGNHIAANLTLFTEAVEEMGKDVDNALDTWQGEGAAAAGVRAVGEKLTATKIDEAATIVASDCCLYGSVLDTARTDLLDLVDNQAAGAGMTVADDGTVTPPKFPGADGTLAAAMIQQRLENQADWLQSRIQDLLSSYANNERYAADHLGLVTQSLDQLQQAPAADVEIPQVPTTGDGLPKADVGELGADDGKAVRDAVNADGSVDTAVLDEVADRLPKRILTDAELTALSNGGEVDTLPAYVQDYYRSFLQNAGKPGILALNDRLKQQEEAGDQGAATQRDTLANGLLAVSNEDIGTGRNPDGSLQSPGSYQDLPQDLRELISTRVAGPDANATTYPTEPPEIQAAARTRFLDETARFGDLISQANPGYEPGVELSRELTRQVASMATPAGTSDYSALPGGNNLLSELEPSMRDYLEVSGRNHEATTQLLTGETNPGSVPLEDGYNPLSVVQPLLHYDWTDGEGQEPPPLFNWIGEQAVPQPPTADGPGVTLEQSQQAGAAASALFGIMTQGSSPDGAMSPFEALMDMPYHDNQSLGQVNPGLTQQVADAMIPYLDEIAMAPDYLSDTNGFQIPGETSDERDTRAIRLLTLLNSDPEASALVNAAIIDRTNDYAAHYVDIHDQESNARDQIAESAGRLIGYQEQGLRAEAWDRGIDASNFENSSVNNLNMGVDIAAGVLDTFVPNASGAFDVANKVFRYDINDIDFTAVPESTYKANQDELATQRFYSMLTAAANSDPEFFNSKGPRSATFPTEWLEDGRLKPYKEIFSPSATDDPVYTKAEFGSAARQWLRSAGIDITSFTDALGNQADRYDRLTSSREDYESRILKGGNSGE